MSVVSQAYAILNAGQAPAMTLRGTQKPRKTGGSLGKRHMARVAACGCAVGNRGLGQCAGKIEVHHVSEASGRRSDFATVCLCHEHHDGASGFHGIKAKAFCKLYRVPWEKEEGLLVWAAEDLERLQEGLTSGPIGRI